MKKCLLKYALLLMFSLSYTVLFGQQSSLLKTFLTVEEGLSNNEVTSIVQDKDGFIWIGTRGGLNRYDGYGFKIFNQVPGDSNSLVNPSIECLFVDSKSKIWIGTKSGGVSKYDPETGIFKNIATNYKQTSNLLPDNRILCFHEDKKGRIWIGTWENGLVIYDQENNTSLKYLSGKVNSIVETSAGQIWVGTENGLFEYIEKDNLFKIYQSGQCQEINYDDKRNVLWLTGSNNSGLKKFDLRNYKITAYKINDPANPNTIHSYQSLLIDDSNKIWIGTWGTGFYEFDPENESFKRYLIYPENQATINKDYDAVLDIFKDKDGNIWLGTNGGGVCVLTQKLGFKSVGYHPDPNKGLQNTRIMSVVDDSKGNLWLGTIGSGLFWSPDRENFFHVPNKAFTDSRFFIIKYIYEDEDGQIWVGSNNSTFIIKFKNGSPELLKTESLFNNPVFRFPFVSFTDAFNMLWLGSLEGGLFLVDKKNNYQRIKSINKGNPTSGDLKSDRISYLLKDSKDRIWIGTYNGLHIYNSKDTTVHPVESYYKITGEFTGNIITCIDEDNKGNIWIGTPNGLNRLTETADSIFTVDYFTENDGLASNFIKGIAHDINGNIWVSTNIGITKCVFNESANRFVNFDESDGVKGKNFTEASVFRNEKGEIFFGGAQGLTYFNPDEINEHQNAHKPIFTGLKVLNQAIEAGNEPDTKKILFKSITHSDKIELSYRQNNFEIEFSALDYKSIGKNQYQYILENNDKNWNLIGHRRFVNFNNLRPGEYTLKVKSANGHNIWNENPAELKILIHPPFWQTWYALVFYILIVVGIVTIIRWNAVKQVRLASNLELEKMQHLQDQKLNEQKLRFFTNLSHEFRTPLTLILAPLKELIRKKEKYELSDEAFHKISLVQNNSIRLMKLVNQLLNFRKVESGKMKLFASYSNLEDYVLEVCHPFSELAKINNISFKLKSSLKTKELWFDREKLEIILNNLISNSFKFLKENGKIEVALYEEEDVVLLSISDNGPGIPVSEIDHIFDRFYRAKQTENHGSSGIGLAVTKQFVELHKGTISATSEPNKHTEFVVSLLKGKKHLSDDEIVELEGKDTTFVKKEQFLKTILPGRVKAQSRSEECILIVEDDIEVNQYLKDLLEPNYCIETVFNGLEAIEKIEERKPDLIISDIMMPKMDGFELCKTIKSNESTATIPFVFLTSKTDEQFRLLGTQLGADDFISKPFDPNLLLEKVKNILEGRKKLQKKYSKSIRLGPSEIEITSGDEIFIEKVILTIEENLQNHKFTSDVLASEMNMSNSSLYRKLKVLTGSSTAEFIRSIRIKRAAQLLADKEKTITEIAYEVGFNDVKHFRTIFQKQFSCSPSEFRSKIST